MLGLKGVQPFPDLSARGEPYHRQVRIFGTSKELRILIFPSPKRLQDPQRHRVWTDQSTETLPVPAPKFLTRHDPAHRPPQNPSENDSERKIEPYDRLRLAPNDVPDLTVVSVDHPRSFARRFIDLSPEFVERGLGPSWLPMEGVQFHMFDVQSLGDLGGDGGLTRTACADY